MKKRIISLLLVVAVFVPMLATTANAASNDYTTWKQYDEEWNQKEAWPKKDYPKATYTKMRQAGCVVTSIAMLLRHYDVVKESNVNRFNPWILNEQLKTNGCFDSAANLIWGNVDRVYPTFKFVKTVTYSLTTLTTLYNQGYACLVRVNGSGGNSHYVAVHSVSGSTVKIMDPGSNKTTLDGYNKYQILYYSISSQGTPVPQKYATISGQNTPTSLTKGKTYSIRGTISSGTKITSVTAGIYTSSSGTNMVYGKTVQPNTTSYRLTNVDRYLYFNKLNAGTYYYIVKATNSAGTKTLVNQKFTVSNPAAPKYATISGHNAPTSLTKGKTYSIKGTISSSTKITSVSVGVYTAQSGGTRKTGTSTAPNRTSYNLANLDRYVTFNTLSAGTYYYRVTAKNSAGTVTLINQKFTVSNPVSAAPKYAAISGYNAPTSLTKGKTYSIKGTISSSTKITSVTAGIYTSSSGANMVYGKTVQPNTTSYSLTNVDRYLYFNKLSVGTYYYIVKAANSAGTKTLINQRFTVSASIPSKWGTLTPKCAPGARLDVTSSGTGDGVNVQIWGANGTSAQSWRLVDLGNGYYAIQSAVSGKCLDVAGGKTASGTNVQQYTWNATNAQQWKLIDAGGGYYYICPRLNLNLCLDVHGGGSASGTNVWVHARNNTQAQMWKFS